MERDEGGRWRKENCTSGNLAAATSAATATESNLATAAAIATDAAGVTTAVAAAGRGGAERDRRARSSEELGIDAAEEFGNM